MARIETFFIELHVSPLSRGKKKNVPCRDKLSATQSGVGTVATPPASASGWPGGRNRASILECY